MENLQSLNHVFPTSFYFRILVKCYKIDARCTRLTGKRQNAMHDGVCLREGGAPSILLTHCLLACWSSKAIVDDALCGSRM